MSSFDLTAEERKLLMSFLLDKLESFYAHPRALQVSPGLDLAEIVRLVREQDFNVPLDGKTALSKVLSGLDKYLVHCQHPRYFGLFNPRTNFAAIIADIVSAFYNPQLAAWSHAPYAVEVERYLVQAFGEKFGYAAADADGVFATGGAEANLTAVLCALNERLPDFASSGAVGLVKRPIIYCSVQAHHSVVKSARAAGLGLQSIRHIHVTDDLKMDPAALASEIAWDLSAGNLPLMIVGTAGTTGPGTIDSLEKLGQLAASNRLWFHVDAAYGGAVMMNPDYRHWLKGIENADSITFDVHKWLAVPMSASLFLTRHRSILEKTFRATAEYMPREASNLGIVDPSTHSIQWSRRFIRLKLYLSLMIFGWEGYAQMIQQQLQIGAYLEKLLAVHNWRQINQTPLPVYCFTDPDLGQDNMFATIICEKVIRSGEAWLSVYPVNGLNCLRVCITNYATTEADIDQLLAVLNTSRLAYASEKEAVVDHNF